MDATLHGPRRHRARREGFAGPLGSGVLVHGRKAMATIAKYHILVYGSEQGYQTKQALIALYGSDNKVIAYVRFNDPGMAFESDSNTGSIIPARSPSARFRVPWTSSAMRSLSTSISPRTAAFSEPHPRNPWARARAKEPESDSGRRRRSAQRAGWRRTSAINAPVCLFQSTPSYSVLER